MFYLFYGKLDPPQTNFIIRVVSHHTFFMDIVPMVIALHSCVFGCIVLYQYFSLVYFIFYCFSCKLLLAMKKRALAPEIYSL